MSNLLPGLQEETKRIGKPEWRPMLQYVAALHARSIHPPRKPFPHPWEEIGPGYCYAPAFGHWDIVHQVLDVLPAEPGHARMQLLNNIAAQQEDGHVPGAIWMREQEPRWSETVTHPPLWQVAVQDLVDSAGEKDLIERSFDPLTKLIGWYERNRKAEPDGFYYTDILTKKWESGVDEGVRFVDASPGPRACVDATAHVYWMYAYATRWARMLGKDPAPWAAHAGRLRALMSGSLFCGETGYFHDAWLVDDPKRPMSFEGMWPMVVGAASPDQARRVIHENLLEPRRFFAKHPISSVGVEDPRFELRMWRGPAWNSMTYWAARGCLDCGEPAAARALLEGALDASAAQFDRTETIWEFYHPHVGDQLTVKRKPHTQFNAPCRDYLGHSPLIAMARMWAKT